MPYLSRIRVNPLRTQARKLLSNPEAMHAAVLSGLPARRDNERVLWRIDTDDPRSPALYVLTGSRPDWNHIIEQAGWPNADGEHALVRDYTPVLGQVATGVEFAFRLTANPVQSTKSPIAPTPSQAIRAQGPDERRRGYRLAHRTVTHQLQWLLNRTPQWGFTIPEADMSEPAPGLIAADAPPPRDVRITARTRRSFTKKATSGPVVFHAVTFQGRLVVTDPELLRGKLLAGIGPSKAYGCGLLTLAPTTARELARGGR
jgi:CRISPR system Cascade subunit CasE